VYRTRSTEHPWIEHVLHGGSPRATRLSDLRSEAELRRSAFYVDFFRPRGVDYADYQHLPTSGDHVVGFAICRRARNFTDDEHDLFEHLRRPLGRIHDLIARAEDAAARRRTEGTPVGLTPAETRVSDLIRQGWRNARIAEHLGISVKAVEQHATRIYRKNHVVSRAEYILQSVAPERDN
jgi:DNA-binding CsgD family transcriptional regulator